MCGWFSDASTSPRARSAPGGPGRREKSGSILMATSRSSRVSRARYTSPIPPAPSGAMILYRPRRNPLTIAIRRERRHCRHKQRRGQPNSLNSLTSLADWRMRILHWADAESIFWRLLVGATGCWAARDHGWYTRHPMRSIDDRQTDHLLQPARVSVDGVTRPGPIHPAGAHPVRTRTAARSGRD